MEEDWLGVEVRQEQYSVSIPLAPSAMYLLNVCWMSEKGFREIALDIGIHLTLGENTRDHKVANEIGVGDEW